MKVYFVSKFNSVGNVLLVMHDKALISKKRVKNFAILFKVSDIIVVMKNRRYAWYFFPFSIVFNNDQ